MRVLAPHLAESRVIAAHLGNGASLCAMKAGRSVDTTMGFTALDGLMMGTRCGNLDPGVILYLEQQRGLDTKQVEDILYRRSRLLGVSAASGAICGTLEASNDPRAKEAIDLFVYRIVREIGALTSSLAVSMPRIHRRHRRTFGGDSRARLRRIGVAWGQPDLEANHRNAINIGDKQSRVSVWAIPTDEEAMIARHTRDTVGAPAPAL